MFNRSGNGVADESGHPAKRAHGGAASNPPPASGRGQQQLDDFDAEVPKSARNWATAFAALCAVVVLASPGVIPDGQEVSFIWPPDPRAWADWVLQLHWVLAFLVISPLLLVNIVLLDLHALRPRSRRYMLVAREPSMACIPEGHAAEDKELWSKRKVAIEASWAYEKERILRLQCRLVLQALIFGDVTTFALMCAALGVSSGHGTDSPVLRLACSVAAAAATAFLSSFGRIMLRISGGDITARAFSWAIRSVALVVIADLGLCVLLDSQLKDASPIKSVTYAMLLGLFVGATGEHAIEFLLDKAAKMFGTGSGDTRKTSPLLDIEGMTAAHVERLEEEGIVSIHDLAFAPTARLFFSTAYSLQQICNWQDRALLLVYVGKKSAEALAEQMNIRGAIDLRAFAHDILFGGGVAKVDQLKESLRKALNVDPGGLDAVLESMAHDEVTMRIRFYWGGVISPEPRKRDPESPAVPAQQVAPAVTQLAAVVAAAQTVIPPTPHAVLRPVAQTSSPSPPGAVPPDPQGTLRPDAPSTAADAANGEHGANP